MSASGALLGGPMLGLGLLLMGLLPRRWRPVDRRWLFVAAAASLAVGAVALEAM